MNIENIYIHMINFCYLNVVTFVTFNIVSLGDHSQVICSYVHTYICYILKHVHVHIYVIFLCTWTIKYI
jgi:hypothetical protein